MSLSVSHFSHPPAGEAGPTSRILVDSHTHVHFPAYDSDRNEVIKRAQIAGVKMITVGTQLSTSKSAIELAEKYPNDVWATVGFHPGHVVLAQHAQTSRTRPLAPERSDGGRAERRPTQTVRMGARDSHAWHHDKNEQASAEPEEFNVLELEKLAHHPKVVAIGECGLDYFRLPLTNADGTRTDADYMSTNADWTPTDAEVIKEKQKDIFLQQVELAQKVNKPLMIHCRPSYAKASEGKPPKSTDDAYNDLLVVISKFNPPAGGQNPKIVHFFVGSLETARKLLESNFYFTFGGVITFVRDYDEIIKYIPLDRILLETDAPYVAPAPYRGKRNEPAYIIETAKKLAEIKNMNYEDVVAAISGNAIKIFKIAIDG